VFVFSERICVLDGQSGALRQTLLRDKQEYWSEHDEIVEALTSGRFKIASSGLTDTFPMRYGVSVIDQSGKALWSYSSSDGGGFAVCDADGDGKPEFYVASDHGLVRLDDNGHRVWGTSGSFYEVAAVPSGVGKELIVTRDSNYSLSFWNADGSAAKGGKRVTPADHFCNIRTCNWPAEGHILGCTGGWILVIDHEGNRVLSAPLTEHAIFEMNGTPVQFDPHKKPYLAVVGRLRAETGLSVLGVFSPEGELVYREVVNITTGIAALPIPRTGREALLVGDGPGKVYKYEPVAVQ